MDALKVFARNKPALVAFVMLLGLATAATTGAIWTGKRADAAELIRMEESELVGDNYRTEAVKNSKADPVSTELLDTFLPPLSMSSKDPGRRYWMGTDHLGRDVAARLWAGSSISLLIGFLAVGISVFLGITLGGVAGYFGRERVGLIVMVTLALLLAWGVLLAAGLPVPAWICFGFGALLLTAQFGIAMMGARWRTGAFFVLAVALFGVLALYNREVESGTPEGALYLEAKSTHEQAYEQLLHLRDYGREVKAWEEENPANLAKLADGKDLPGWLYAGQLNIEIETRLLNMQVIRLGMVKAEGDDLKSLRLAEDQQERAAHLEQFIDEYRRRFEEASADEAAATRESERLFKEDQRDEARAKAEEAANHNARKTTFDPVALQSRLEKLRATARASEIYWQAIIEARAKTIEDYRTKLADVEEALRGIGEQAPQDEKSLRAAQLDVESTLRGWAVTEAEYQEAWAVARVAAYKSAVEKLEEEGAKDDHAGLQAMKAGLADAEKAITPPAEDQLAPAAEAVKAAKDKLAEIDGREKSKDEAEVKGVRQLDASEKAEDIDVAKKKLAHWPVLGSNALVDRRGKLRKNFVTKYETEMRNGRTSLRVAEKLNGEYRYSFYRVTSHFLTATVVYLLLIVAALLVMAAAQGVVSDRLRALKPLYLPTISVDDLVMRFTEIMLTIPVIFLILAILAIFEKDVYITMGVIGLTSWMTTTRFVRAEILSLREQDFIQSARALGLSDFRIIWRHLVPNSISPVLVSATLGVAGAVLAESTLSFLGIGAKPDQTTWGLILSEGREYIFDASWLTWIPGIAILITVLSFNLLGEGLREAFNPKLRGR
jgi:ABC-type dipeptide/oligopeptide/nickel transport system permease subunit